MFIQQLYTDCLAEAAYYIESNGEAAVIDPIRDIDSVLALAKERGATIKYIFETHFHADFVSGHLDLASETGATVVFGPSAKTEYAIHEATDGEEFAIGDVRISALHTPGHTLESTCYLLSDKDGIPHAVFTGDTVFVGDVGRPDLAVKSDLTSAQLAEMLYDSIETKIKPLADNVLIYPGHGAGSACGKNMSDEKFSTVGAQKKANYALKAKDKADFVHMVLDGQSQPPKYFPTDVLLNKTGYTALSMVIKNSMKKLSIAAAEAAQKDGALLLDIRSTSEFCEGHVPKSVSIAPDGQFASWFGSLFSFDQPAILIGGDKAAAKEAVIRLARVGFENVQGFVENGAAAYADAGGALARISCVNADSAKDYNILDIRNVGEHDSRRVDGSLNIPLAELEARLDELAADKTYALHCATGYRSVIASSILMRAGKTNFVNVLGGFEAMESQSELCFADGICPSKLRDMQAEEN